MKETSETKLRVIVRGGAGIELGFVGFGWGGDLFHRYLSLGVVTLYITTEPLVRYLARQRAAREELKGEGK